MTDKQKIKEEIERLKTQNETYLDKEYAESTKWHKHGAYDACNAILSFINSLPEEHKKQPKFKVGDKIKGPHNNIFEIKEVLENQYVLHSENGDELNSITIVDRNSYVVEEPVSEDLEEYAKKLAKGAALDKHNLIWMCKKGAEWQKRKDQETIELAEDHAMLAGMNKMKEEMMKDAVEGTVKYEIGSAEIPQCDRRYQVLSNPIPITNAKLGDKVKILILKTE